MEKLAKYANMQSASVWYLVVTVWWPVESVTRSKECHQRHHVSGASHVYESVTSPRLDHRIITLSLIIPGITLFFKWSLS